MNFIAPQCTVPIRNIPYLNMVPSVVGQPIFTDCLDARAFFHY